MARTMADEWNAGQVVKAAMTSGRLWAALVPLVVLFGYWMFGERFLVLSALTGPLVLIAISAFRPMPSMQRGANLRGLPGRGMAIPHIEASLQERAKGKMDFACFVMEIDSLPEIASTYGQAVLREVLERSTALIESRVRAGDLLVRLDETRLAVVAAPMRRADAETLIQVASRYQGAMGEPFHIDGIRLDLSLSIGFAAPQMIGVQEAGALLDAAERALVEAHRVGNGAIRAYSAELVKTCYEPSRFYSEIAPALHSGQIVALYQPVLSTSTGEVASIDVQPVWNHPELGQIPFAEFRDAVCAEGESEHLRSVMLHHALNSLRSWQRAGLGVPSVSVALGSQCLADPKLVDKLVWELDRFDVAPDFLVLCVKEAALSRQDEEIVQRNLAAITSAGFGLALTGFGTGSASISAIRRSGAHEIRVDRSFVADIDGDPEQQRMFHALVEMSAQIGVEVLADSIESIGEHSMLAQLGCAYAQGRAIAPSMPFTETHDWLIRHAAKLTPVAMARKTAS